MSLIRFTALYAKYSLIETYRIPMAWIGNLVFPALALCFFVLPQRSVADNPTYATAAVISMATFAIMTSSLFGFGMGVAQNRERPWDAYQRTLPAPALARILSEVFSTGLVGIVAVIPLVVIGKLFTAATVPVPNLLLAYLVLVLCALPFMFMGICVGYAFSARAAIAVVQILMFAMAFGGGLFLPPQLFPDWLDTLSQALPSRQAREIVIWAAQGVDVNGWLVVGLIAWTAALLWLALLLFRRDQTRRFV